MSGESPNIFFNNYKNSQEQQLLEDLIIESINIYGQSMFYVPRVITNPDKLYTADDQSTYLQAFEVPIYTESFDRFTGDGSFMSKFGLEIRNQIILCIAQRVFSEEVSAFNAQKRPNEGDLIYYPLNDNCFQIKYVEKFEMFYPLGKLYVWKMVCELFEYSNEVINTGVPEIDKMQRLLSTNVFDYSVLDEQGNKLMTEDGDFIVNESYDLEQIIGTGENDIIQIESDKFVDFSVKDPFSEGKI